MTRIALIPTSRAANFFRLERDPLGFLVDALGGCRSRTSSVRPTFVVNSPAFYCGKSLVHQGSSISKEEAQAC